MTRERDEEIRKIISDTVSATILRFKAAGILRDGEKNAVDKTEELLRQYKTLQKLDQPYAKALVGRINECLEDIKDDPYADIIRLYYFDGLTNAAASDKLFCDERTGRRNRKRLVKTFAQYLVSEDFIRELLIM